MSSKRYLSDVLHSETDGEFINPEVGAGRISDPGERKRTRYAYPFDTTGAELNGREDLSGD